MRANECDFIPFLVDEGGNVFDHQQFLKYCDECENSAAWGGHYEVWFV
jgi:hypothetical protein